MPPSDEFKKALRAGDLPEAFMTAMGKATELNITTRVIGADRNGESNPAQTLHTRLDLLSGTIENEVGEEFLSSGQYKDLQQFHQQQVALGNRKIQENFQSLQQLFQLLVTLQQYNRLNNAEEPLDLAFLEVPSHLLPTEKVITTLKEREQQQAVLESFATPDVSSPPDMDFDAAEMPTEDIQESAPVEPQRPAPIPPKPMAAFGVAAVAGGAIAKSQQRKQDHGDEPLNFLDGFAALDLDAEPDPLMPVSDLEIEDWEAPAAMSPAQRNAQQTTTAYVPSLNDFDHDELDDVPDLDDLLGEDLDPLGDLLEDPSIGDVAYAEDAAIAPEDFPTEVQEGLLAIPETEEEGLGAISLGQASPHAPQEAVDPDLEALLEEADAAHHALEDLEIFDSLESLPEAIAPEPPEPLAEPEASLPETVLTETSFGELLDAADAMTPEMTVELLDETLDGLDGAALSPDFPEATAAPTVASGIENLGDRDLLDFINQDWQSHPEVMEITSLDEEGDGEQALLQPLSAEELAELEEMSRTDDDWQPLAGAGEFEALNLDLADTAQALPVETSEDLDDDLIDDDWQPLAGKAHEAIEIESLLPLELDHGDLDNLEVGSGDELGAIATEDELDLLDMAEMDLDLEADLEMPLSSDAGDLGTLDSVDPAAAFEQDDLDLVEMPDEMRDLGEAFGEDFSSDLDGLGGVDGIDDEALLSDEPLDDIDGFTETTDDFGLGDEDLGDLDDADLAFTDEASDEFTETTDDFELGDEDLGDLDDAGLAFTDETSDEFTETTDDFELGDGDLGDIGDIDDLDDSGLALTDEAIADALAENWLDEAGEPEGELSDFNADSPAGFVDPFAGTDDLWDQRGEVANFATDETLEPLSDEALSAEMDLDADESFDALGDLDAAAMGGDPENWLDQFDETDSENDDFGLGSDLDAEADFDLGMDGGISENFSFDRSLSDEVLNSINELDQTTADLLSSHQVEGVDGDLFDGSDSTAIDGFTDPEAEDTLGDLNLDDDVAAMSFTSDVDDSNWDADLDAALLDTDLGDDAPIDLEIKDLSDGDFALTGFDDSEDLGAIAEAAGAEDGWDNLAATTNVQNGADWGELENPVSQGDNGEDWGIADLEGLGDFDQEDLSGLADFDLEALENDDNDDDFDLFGNEDSEALNPFFESKP